MSTFHLTDVFGDTHEFDTDLVDLSSDLHLNHGNILKYGRGDRWTMIDTMNHAILDALYASRDRQLILLGDLVMGPREQGLPLLHDLGFTIFNIPGNHDHAHPMHKKSAEWVERYRDLGNVITLQPEVFLPMTDIGPVTLCHFPFDGDHTEDIRYEDWRPTDFGQYLIHGHLHGTHGALTGPRSVDIGVDAMDFQPVPLTTVFDLLTIGVQ